MRKQYWLLPIVGFVILGLSGTDGIHAQARRGITPEDYFSFQFVGDPHFSPDGKVVAYELTTVDSKKNRRESSIWLVPTDGSTPPRRLSAEGFTSHAPRWSPGGKTLAILSSR